MATDLHDLVGKQYNAASGDVTLFSGDCRVYRVSVREVGSTAANVDVYDGPSASGTRIATLRMSDADDNVDYAEARWRQGYYCDTSLTLDVTAGTIEIIAVYFVDENASGALA